MTLALGHPDLTPARTSRVMHAMRALGRSSPPATVTCNGVTYRHERTVKHDFWAATAFYLSATGERVVLKLGRTCDFAGCPLKWTGRFLRYREVWFYRRLADLPNVPKLLGLVGETGFVHTFIAGQPLSNKPAIPDGYFDKLMKLMAELHRRGIGYVDTNKPQNILVGDDGEPYLIDFQISWDSEWSRIMPLRRWLARKAAAADVYHILKHKRRLRPDEMSPADYEIAARRGWLVRLHRVLSRPYFGLRRRTFKRLRQTGRLLPEGSK